MGSAAVIFLILMIPLVILWATGLFDGEYEAPGIIKGGLNDLKLPGPGRIPDTLSGKCSYCARSFYPLEKGPCYGCGAPVIRPAPLPEPAWNDSGDEVRAVLRKVYFPRYQELPPPGPPSQIVRSIKANPATIIPRYQDLPPGRPNIIRR